MYSVPYTPRQAVRSPTPPGNSNADLDHLLFNNDEFFFSDIFSSDLSPSFNIHRPDTFFPFFDNYTLDPEFFPEPAPQESIFRTDPIEGDYHLLQYGTALTLSEDPSHIAPSHATPILELQQSQEGLEPNYYTGPKNKETTGEDNSNSPESTGSPGSNSSRDSQKRKLEDMMQSFPVLDNQVSEKRRKNYDEKTREKVALMRKIKACKRCRIQKISVRRSVYSSNSDVLTLLV